MKKIRILVFMLAAAVITGIMGTAPTRADNSPLTLDVMFTSDLHSHFYSFETIMNDGEAEQNVGGLDRIKTLVDEQMNRNPDTLMLDGGDFSMGTLVQTVYETEAAELRMLGYLGIDVTTLGNHEYDFRSSGLKNMLDSAVKSGEALPEIAICNINWDAMESDGLTKDQELLKSAFDEYAVKDYVMVQKGEVSIAVIGVFGNDALACAPTCALLFNDPVKAVADTVKDIKANEDADMIVLVSHSGTNSDSKKSEDEIMAKKVSDLDLIISGHSHTIIDEPIVYGDTYIVAPGEYGEFLGSLSMTQKDNGRWNMDNYQLIPINASVPSDAAAIDKMNGFMDSVDTRYLSQFGYTKDMILANNDVEFCRQKDLETEHTEHNLGSFIADAYIYAVENADDYDGITVNMAAVPSGTVRDTYTKGNVTVEQVYNSFSLGTGADGIAGYPLISVYLTGAELKTIAEVDASVSDYMTTARLYLSGMNFTFNPHRILLNKVSDIYLTDTAGNRVELEDDKLYRVVADLYSGQMLGSVTDMSYGLLSIIPKYADGTPIDNFEDAIIYDGDKELKAWDAIARYMQSFEDTDGDGFANIPEYYATNHDRKVVDDSRNIFKNLKGLNKYAWMIIGVVFLLIVIIGLLIFFLVKLIRKIILSKVHAHVVE